MPRRGEGPMIGSMDNLPGLRAATVAARRARPLAGVLLALLALGAVALPVAAVDPSPSASASAAAPGGSPSASPSAAPSASPSPSPTPSPTATPSPTPTPSPT